MDTLSYPYRPRPWVMALVCIFFLACALVMAQEASTNTRGLIIGRIIHLDTQGATSFYWGLVAVSAMFAAAGVAGLILGLLSKRQIVLSDGSLSVPSLWTSRPATVVKLSDIQSMAMQVISKNTFLVLMHEGGKVSIPANHLPNRETFDHLCNEIARRRAALS